MPVPPANPIFAAVNRCKNLFAVVSALVASTTLGQAELIFTQGSIRTYRQAPDAVNFREGSMLVRLRDGNFVYMAGGCPNRSLFYYPPSIPCPIGATGYVVGGDADNDGNRDEFTYWSVMEVIPAFYIEPSRPELCTLFAAPPSKLPRNVLGFTNWSTDVYYNIQTEAVTEYNISFYRLDIPYTTRGQMDAEVVQGTYRWSFPKLRDPDGIKLIIPVENYAIPEGLLKKNNVSSGFRFLRLNGKGLVRNANGFVLMDPRLIATFEWEGNAANNIFPNGDQMFLSLARLAATPVGDPNRAVDLAAQTYYPGFVAPGTSRVLLANPLVTKATIPPGMITIPAPVGTPPSGEGLLRLAIERFMPSGGVSYDTSARTFELPIAFTNTYEGWAAVRFPAGTSAANRAPGADPDRDGKTNIQEWPGNFDPMNAASKPPAPVLAFVQGRSLRSTDSATTGYWQTRHAKVPNAWPPIQYEYEFSPDLKNWTVVGADDPDWVLIDSETELQIRSRHEKLSGQGFLRVKTTQLPEPAPEVIE